MNQELLDYFGNDELAASVWLGKYAQEGETTPTDMHLRMSKEFARIEEKYQAEEYANQDDYANIKPILSDYGDNRKDLTEESIFELFKDFKYVVPQGSVMSNLGTGKITSLSNCFVVDSPNDSYGGIVYSDEQLAQLMKRRGGVGIDVSTLRPSETEVKNAAKSSTGAVSFMERFSNTTREVAQGGRRGALMLSMDINHPDILEFIKIKRDLSKVTGANISIKLNDAFMEAVKNDEDYYLKFPCNITLEPKDVQYDSTDYGVLLTLNSSKYGKGYIKKIKAKEYWDEIIKSAHGVAEPGLMFWDSMVNYSPDGVYPQFKQITTNPCCLVGDILVLVKEGDVSTVTPIKELVGKTVTIFDGVNWVECDSFKSYGLSPTYKVNYSIGDTITTVRCTGNHRWFLKKGKGVVEKLTTELLAGDTLDNVHHLYNEFNILSVELSKENEEVFCPTVLSTGKFTLADGVITGNSEIAMQPYDACRLIAVNLFSFVDNPFTENAKFDFKKFYEVNYESMRLSDDLIDLEVEHIDNILAKINSDPESYFIKERELDLWENIKKTAMSSRRTGLGFTALGDTLAALGVKYDSDEALNVIEQIMAEKMRSELDCTIDLSILRGSFVGWDSYKEFPTIKDSIASEVVGYGNSWYRFTANKFPKQARKMIEHGRRNLSWSTIAPTGSLSILTQTTSGVEPLFMPFYTRRKKINPADKNSRVDFTDQNGDKWQEYAVLHPKFKDWLVLQIDDIGFNYEEKISMVDLMNPDILSGWFKQSPWYNSTANDIDWGKRVDIQAILQQYITHSISSTINLPNDVSLEAVSEIYKRSWEKGLKGITVYRDGSRSGVLVSSDNKEKAEFSTHNAPKRPKELKAVSTNVKVKGVPYAVIVGLMDDKPYEVFCLSSTKVVGGEGVVVREGKAKYNFCIGEECYSMTESLTDEEATITRLISTSLRHGADIKYIVEQLQKTKGDITSFVTAINRVLSKYTKGSDIKTGVKCENCGSHNIIFEEGCFKCMDCGSSKCG